ncbi:MAG: redoxin domain-containing protein [Pirellulales bacterium]
MRHEIKLTEHQAAALDKTLAQVDGSLWSIRDDHSKKATENRAQVYDHVRKHLATLKPEQRKRFDNIFAQFHGWPSLLLPEYVDQLASTPHDAAAFRTALAPVLAEKKTPADYAQRIPPLLTSAQNAKLPGLLGEAFDTKKIRDRHAPAPELIGIKTWLNGEHLTLEKLRGKVVIVHFWTFGCVNCLHNLPHYRKWHADYAGKDVVILGIHTPETATESRSRRGPRESR